MLTFAHYSLPTLTHGLQVAQYHHDFYRAENLALVIVGEIPPAQLFAALQPVIQSIEAAAVCLVNIHLFNLCNYMFIYMYIYIYYFFRFAPKLCAKFCRLMLVSLCAVGVVVLTVVCSCKCASNVMTQASKGPFTRPWLQPVPQLAASSIKTVSFPSDDESCGSVKMAWMGPEWYTILICLFFKSDK